MIFDTSITSSDCVKLFQHPVKFLMETILLVLKTFVLLLVELVF